MISNGASSGVGPPTSLLIALILNVESVQKEFVDSKPAAKSKITEVVSETLVGVGATAIGVN